VALFDIDGHERFDRDHAPALDVEIDLAERALRDAPEVLGLSPREGLERR
jgi:hypothetical protein